MRLDNLWLLFRNGVFFEVVNLYKIFMCKVDVVEKSFLRYDNMDNLLVRDIEILNIWFLEVYWVSSFWEILSLNLCFRVGEE